MRGRRRGGDRNDRQQEDGIGGNKYEEGSNQSGPRLKQSRSHSRESYRYRDCSHSREFRRNRNQSPSWETGQRQGHSYSQENQVRDLLSPEEGQPRNTAMDVMSRALQKATRSPFSSEIERVEMPDRFARPPFNCYDEKTDPIEQVSHYIQMMSLHTHNNVLMCKVFPSSLGLTTLRWFNGLRKGSIQSFSKLIQEFGVLFVTCSRVSQPIFIFSFTASTAFSLPALSRPTSSERSFTFSFSIWASWAAY